MKLRADLQGHFWAGLAICLAVSLFVSPAIGLLVSALAGLVKELIDKLGFGTPDPMDFVSTFAGGLVGFGLIIVSQWA